MTTHAQLLDAIPVLTDYSRLLPNEPTAADPVFWRLTDAEVEAWEAGE